MPKPSAANAASIVPYTAYIIPNAATSSVFDFTAAASAQPFTAPSNATVSVGASCGAYWATSGAIAATEAAVSCATTNIDPTALAAAACTTNSSLASASGATETIATSCDSTAIRDADAASPAVA